MLKELEDFKWFPSILRRWQMDFIGSITAWTKLYSGLVPVIQDLVLKNKITVWQDVCSGSGIPAIYIHQKLNTSIPLQLTDKYPDVSFVNTQHINYRLEETDIQLLQPSSHRLYTMFNAFHHFTEKQQTDFANKMKNSNAPFFVAEILEPGIFNCIKIFFTTILVQLITAPFIKPFSLPRLFFTYIIPVNLFTITYDGIISVLKSKTAEDYRTLLQHISSPQYKISVQQLNNFKGNIIYITGIPVNT